MSLWIVGEVEIGDRGANPRHKVTRLQGLGNHSELGVLPPWLKARDLREYKLQVLQEIAHACVAGRRRVEQ